MDSHIHRTRFWRCSIKSAEQLLTCTNRLHQLYTETWRWAWHLESRDGTVVKKLTSHCWAQFWFPAWHYKWVEFVFGSDLYRESFSSGLFAFPPSLMANTPNSRLNLKNSGKRANPWRCLCLLFIIYCIWYLIIFTLFVNIKSFGSYFS